jgi:hypothetical protein
MTRLLLVLALLSVTPARGETWMVLGDGQLSCGEFISASEGHTPGMILNMPPVRRDQKFMVSKNSEFMQWLMGFVSGASAALGREIKTDGYALDLWMRNWCKQHPTKSVAEGGGAFIKEMLTPNATDRR